MKLINEGNLSKKFFIKIIIILFSWIIMIYFLILPLIANINGKYNSFIANLIEDEKNYEKNKRYMEVKEKMKKIEPYLDKINSLFINKSRELEIITTLENIAEKNNVKQTLNFSQIQNTDDKNKITIGNINISAQGAYPDLYNYLSAIEKLDFYLNINSLDINNVNSNKSAQNATLQAPSASSLTMNLKGEIFWN
jgi:Tfp pilus assembly protein PilO